MLKKLVHSEEFVSHALCGNIVDNGVSGLLPVPVVLQNNIDIVVIFKSGRVIAVTVS